MENQKTIGQETSFEGVGLHTGQTVHICVKPVGPNTGIIFRRVDKGIDIPAKPEYIIEDLLRRTCISNENVLVNTIEHLMVVFSVLGLDNLIVEIDGEEVPGMDGSAAVFFDAIKSAGIKKQDVARFYIEIKDQIKIEDGKSSVEVLPYDGFKISYQLDYPEKEIGSQFYEIELSDKEKVEQIVNARTFCLKSEAERLKNMGLGQGANYNNTLVIGQDGPIDNEFRFDNELAAHKTLDMIGDLYIAGPIKGHIKAYKCGHGINAMLVKEIVSKELS